MLFLILTNRLYYPLSVVLFHAVVLNCKVNHSEISTAYSYKE